MNCQATYDEYPRYGMSRHTTPRAATRIVIRDYKTARAQIVPMTEGGVHQKQAKDGQWVVIEEAVCAQHEKTLKYGVITIPAEVLGQMSWDGIIDYAVRVYERKQDEATAKRLADEAEYRDHRQHEYDDVTFSIEKVDEPGRRMIANWEMRAVDPERDERPVCHVYVEESEGRAWVHVGEYMNSGRGRGSAEYVRTLMVVYEKALRAAEAWNRATAAE